MFLIVCLCIYECVFFPSVSFEYGYNYFQTLLSNYKEYNGLLGSAYVGFWGQISIFVLDHNGWSKGNTVSLSTKESKNKLLKLYFWTLM